MPRYIETARAKINLTLDVLGRRPDGYHELSSLVAFAEVADIVTLDTGGPPAASSSGPYARSISGENLIEVTLALLHKAEPRLELGTVQLLKRLPVASGIGGGSADAAAVLRAVRRANPLLAAHVDWQAVAARIGADVPVCLENRAAWLLGLGDRIEPLPEPLPSLAVVLANPLVPVPADKTARVFRHLGAAPLGAGHSAPGEREHAFRSQAELIALMRRQGNALEGAARKVVPAIADVMAALAEMPAVELAGLSGAGPTGFAVLADTASAEVAAARLKAAHPGWWIEATTLN
jgi:4-diphosphocytidyl-2-C-methyl-D-erythritol kinase